MAAQERFSLRNVYLYLVCLITLVVSLFAAVNLVQSTVGLLYPDPGYYGLYEPLGNGNDLNEAEIARQEELAQDSQRRQEVLGIVSSATTLLIAVPLYVYHWRRVQSELAPRTAGDATSGVPSA